MTSAALIVVVVAGSFAFADIVLIKALGLGVAIAVALDATVVRALLVPGDDAPAGPLELVGPEPARPRAPGRAAADRGRGRGGRPMTAVPGDRSRGTRQPALAVVASLLAACGGPILANPAARATGRHAGARRHAPARGSRAGRAAARRRAPRPPHRVVVLHRPPPRDRRRPVRVRVRRLPRRARRVPGVMGLAPGADRRDRRPVPLRPARRRSGRRSTARRAA